jgi:hypothetical protein
MAGPERKTFIYVNNRLEGNALETIGAMFVEIHVLTSAVSHGPQRRFSPHKVLTNESGFVARLFIKSPSRVFTKLAESCIMSEGQTGEEGDNRDSPVDPAVTADLFLQWRAPRLGRSNPERMNNPVWEWLIKSRLSAYSANQRFNGPSAAYAGPGWCFDRFGQSSTQLPDGRTILIAGEHEEHYDSDFNIYNDVVIQHLDGEYDIYGYPIEVFPPTDFHTATLTGNSIIIVGCLGYPEQRKPGTTQILILNLATLSISPIQTCGSSPGWIYEHKAILEESGHSILVRGGKIDPGGENASLVENIDDWRLHLTDWRWERLTERLWQRWEFFRKDKRPNHLWEIQQALWSRKVGWKKKLEEQLEQLGHQLGSRPDLALADQLFCPPLPHERMPSADDEYNVVRIKLDGIVVRYVADTHSIQMTVEGTLPFDSVKALTSDLLAKMARLENIPFEIKQL